MSSFISVFLLTRWALAASAVWQFYHPGFSVFATNWASSNLSATRHFTRLRHLLTSEVTVCWLINWATSSPAPQSNPFPFPHTHIQHSQMYFIIALLQLEKLLLTRVGFATLVISSIGKRFSNWFVLVRICLPDLTEGSETTAAHLDSNGMGLSAARCLTPPATSQTRSLLSFYMAGERTVRGSCSQQVLGAGI